MNLRYIFELYALYELFEICYIPSEFTHFLSCAPLAALKSHTM